MATDPLERDVEELGARLVTTQRDLTRYRKDNLELQNRLEEADREINALRIQNVRLLGAIETATQAFSQAMWTPARHGAEAE